MKYMETLCLTQFFYKIRTILNNKAYIQFKMKYRPTCAPHVNRAQRLTEGSAELPWWLPGTCDWPREEDDGCDQGGAEARR